MGKKVLHMVMAAAVLISTTGITINMHFCHDQLIDLALYTPAESCCDTSDEETCDLHEELSQIDHCKDDSIIVDALEDFVGSSLETNFESNQSSDILFWIAKQNSVHFANEDVKSIFTDYYLPPPYLEVKLSQIQSFLI